MYYESVCSSLNYYACRGKGAAWLPPEDWMIRRIIFILLLLGASSSSVIAYNLNIEGRRLHNLGVDMYVGNNQFRVLSIASVSSFIALFTGYFSIMPSLWHKDK
jgi:hypothetical protein